MRPVARARCLFDTPLGACGLVWGPAGVARVQLPESSPAATLARLASEHPESVERGVDAAARPVVEAIVALLSGERRALGFIELDLSRCTPFQRRVAEVTRAIPVGETRTYGQLARSLGDAGLSRAVGGALGRNAFAIVVPCHRVLAASGTGGFSASGGAATKLRLLELEGALDATSPLFARRQGTA